MWTVYIDASISVCWEALVVVVDTVRWVWVWGDLCAGGRAGLTLDRDGAVAVGSDGLPNSRDHPRPGYVWDSSLTHSCLSQHLWLKLRVCVSARAQILAFYLLQCHVPSHSDPSLISHDHILRRVKLRKVAVALELLLLL